MIAVLYLFCGLITFIVWYKYLFPFRDLDQAILAFIMSLFMWPVAVGVMIMLYFAEKKDD